MPRLVLDIPISVLLCIGSFVSAGPAQSPCSNAESPGAMSVGAPVGAVHALLSIDPDGAGPLPSSLVVGGDHDQGNVARWDGASGWSTLGAGFASPVSLLAAMPNGDIVAGVGIGPGIVAVGELHRWSGVAWTQLNASVAGTIFAVHALPSGELVVGGSFTAIDGVPAANLAIWDGATWAEFGGGAAGGVTEFGTTATGELVVAGVFSSVGGVAAERIATWDGVTFSPLGGGLTGAAPLNSPTVNGILTLPNGDLFVSGVFMFAGGTFANGMARWDGSTWSSLGGGLSSITIYPASVTGAGLLPNGDIVTTGTAIGTPSWNGWAYRWTGTNWVDYAGIFGSIVHTVAPAPHGLVVGASDGIHEVSTTCVAAAVPYGAACPSSGGANELAADSLPYTGGTFSMTATGLPQNALIAIDGGFAPFGPASLTSLGLPAAAPTCMLHITPEYFELGLPTAGQFAYQWKLPNDPVFAGAEIYFQLVVFEMNANFQLVETTSTNALQLTIGAF